MCGVSVAGPARGEGARWHEHWPSVVPEGPLFRGTLRNTPPPFSSLCPQEEREEQTQIQIQRQFEEKVARSTQLRQMYIAGIVHKVGWGRNSSYASPPPPLSKAPTTARAGLH